MKKFTLVLPVLLAGVLSALPAHAAPLKVVATTQDLESLAKEVMAATPDVVQRMEKLLSGK